MEDEPSRKRKADESLDMSKVKVETRDMACSPIPELVSPEVSPAPAPEESIAGAPESRDSVNIAVREALPSIKIVDLDRAAKKTAKLEFVATNLDGVVSVTAEPVKIAFSLASMDWTVTLKMEKSRELCLGWQINKKNYANEWKIVASLNWVLSTPDESLDRKIGPTWRVGKKQFESEAYSWYWPKVGESTWLPLISMPGDGLRTARTVVCVDMVLSIRDIIGFRLRHSFTYDFTEPSKDSNLLLKFGDDGVYINCNFLSFHSDYFSATKDRLAEMKKDANGFPFVEMDERKEEFIELMEIVYPSKHKVTDKNIAYILPLADRFLLDGVMRECETFLMSPLSQCDIFLKLLWSSQYAMNDLQEWCFAQFKTRQDINKVKLCAVYPELKKTGKILIGLFEKLSDLPK